MLNEDIVHAMKVVTVHALDLSIMIAALQSLCISQPYSMLTGPSARGCSGCFTLQSATGWKP